MRTGMRCWIFTKLPAELSVGTNEYLEPVAPDIEVTLPLNSLSLMASTVTNTSCPIVSPYNWQRSISGYQEEYR